ncbi:hypothetical protein GCM10025865_18590 [Paraoerskovia sediminicola]|uniref:Uncharacterized protein n=1 Tax=Paraoerskovia sediminicola TaxID=1138587 RepID=A0ABN6XCU1_9CELL|nr:hypothetical protein [Paraoerskovia sediminicola]BDZ42560.1 hypothetical protein GCM10025865_18590 [Paraoerskovia sediminicola]
MSASTRAVATAVAAALLASAAFLGTVWLVAAVVAAVLVLAFGWPALLDLPAPTGTRVVVALAGVAAVLAVRATDGARSLIELPLVLAGAIVLAFVAEMVRRDGRTRLLDSVAGTVSGAVVAVSAAGWLATERADDGVSVVVACAVGLAVAAAFSAVDLRVWWGEVVTVLVAVLAAGGAGALLPGTTGIEGAWTGLVGGGVVVASHLLFGRLEVVGRSRTAALAATALPVVVAGSLVYVVGLVLAAL